MRNLKRVLSLAITSVMLLGMMVMSAGAASFPDSEKIANVDAVNNLVALGIIKGKDDGNFDPEGIVTRAEMAKMICVAYNGGKDPNLTGGGIYPDTKGHWASGYIDYCANMGFVSGDNKGNFNPNSPVTATEAAKMILVTLGYNAATEKFVNDANWSININTVASQKSLYASISVDTAAGLSRDNAAQMIFNGLNAKMVKYEMVGIIGGNSVSKAEDYADERTILSDKFGASKFIGILDGNSDTKGLSKDDQIVVKGYIDGDDTKDEKTSTFTYKMPNNLEWIGEELTVLFKDASTGIKGQVDDKDTIFGVFNNGTTTVYNIAKNDLQTKKTDNKIKFGDTEYVVKAAKDGDTLIVNNFGAGDTVSASGAMTDKEVTTEFYSKLKAVSGDKVKFVADADGKIYRAYVTASTLGKVTAVSSDKVSISGLGTIKIADNEVYADIAKDDIVVITKLYNKTVADAYSIVAEAKTVTGEITSFDGTDSIEVDGTSYDIAALGTNVSDALTEFKGRIGDEASLYVIGGLVYAVSSSTEVVKNYALVLNNNGGPLNGTYNALKAELLYSDGTKEIVTLHKDSVVAEKGAAIEAANLKPGTLIRYTVVSDDKVKVLNLVADTVEVAAKTNVYNKTTKALTIKDGTAVAGNDAIIYVKTSAAGDYKAYNLRSLNTITAGEDPVNVTWAVDSSGKISAAYIDLGKKPAGATTTTEYGVVTTGGKTVTIGGDSTEYTQYQISTTDSTDEAVVVNVESGTLTKGTMVSFDRSSDDIYDSATAFTLLNPSATVIDIAIKEYSESDEIISYYTATEKDGEVYKGKGAAITKALDEKCVIVYVNAEDNKAGDDIGVSGFDVMTGYLNARIVLDDGAVVAIFIETSGAVNIAD